MPLSPDSFALLAHSEMSSWERPSVKTSPILGTLWERGLAPSSSEKLCSTMCLRARPVMVPFSMYSTFITAALISSALWYLLRGNSVRTRLEYCTSPTRVPCGDTSSRSTMRFTNCFTSSKFWGRTLLEPSITITRSTCPVPHPAGTRRGEKGPAGRCLGPWAGVRLGGGARIPGDLHPNCSTATPGSPGRPS